MTSVAALPVGVLLAGAALLFGRWRPFLQVALALIVLVLIGFLPEGAASHLRWASLHVVLASNDALSHLFALTFSGLLVTAAIYAMRQSDRFELPAAFCCGAGAIGVVLAGDLIALAVFWLLMQVAAGFILRSHGLPGLGASRRFAVIQGLGTLCLLAGLCAAVVLTGTPGFQALAVGGVPRALVLTGVLIGLAAPPLSAWLPDAYPAASWSGAVFLTIFNTTTAVYALLRLFPGLEWLAYVGVVMMVYGIIYGVRENDLRRVLGYGIVSQTGLMVVAVGLGTPSALNGAASLAVVHAISQALLMMTAGAVLAATGESRLTALGGLCRSMPLTATAAGIGAATLAAVPLTAGFLAQPIITEAVASKGATVLWYLLIAASAGVVLHAGLKFPWFVFFHRDRGWEVPDAPASMKFAMVLLSGCCLGFGLAPDLLFRWLPQPVDLSLFTPTLIVTQVQILLFASLMVVLLRDSIARSLGSTIDVDWIWRRQGDWIAKQLRRGSHAAGKGVRDVTFAAGRRVYGASREHWHAVRETDWRSTGRLVWYVMRSTTQRAAQLVQQILGIKRA